MNGHDRRTRATREAIKDAMLELLSKTPFNYISTAALCREACVGRATFYTHYTGLMDVIDELADDAIQATARSSADPYESLSVLSEKALRFGHSRELEEHIELLPLCQRVADNPKYHVLFKDDFISEYIIMRVFRSERPRAVAALSGRFGLSELEAEKVFLFGVMGAYAVNRSMGWKKDEDWYDVQRVLLTYLSGGNESLKKLGSARKGKSEGNI